MRVFQPDAVVLVSVSESPERGPEAESILDLLVDNDIAATWGTRSPVDFALTSSIVAKHPRQALAICLPSGGERAIAEQLRRESLRARSSGLTLATVFTTSSLSPAMHQLLAKYGISAVHITGTPAQRGTSSARALLRASRWLLPMSARASEVPQKLRWGLWRMPQAVDLATQGAWQVRHAVDRAVAAGDRVHLQVDLSAVGAGRSRLLDDLQSVVRQIVSYADQGRLRSETLSATAAAMSQSRASAPACSILRKRAA